MIVKIILLAIAVLVLIVLLRTLTLKPTEAQSAKVELDKIVKENQPDINGALYAMGALPVMQANFHPDSHL